MRLNTTEWLGEMVATTLAGAGAGLVSALFAGQELKQLVGSVVVSAIAGVVGGALYYPVKQSWESRRRDKLADQSSSASKAYSKAYSDNMEIIGRAGRARDRTKTIESTKPTQHRTGTSIKSDR